MGRLTRLTTATVATALSLTTAAALPAGAEAPGKPAFTTSAVVTKPVPVPPRLVGHVWKPTRVIVKGRHPVYVTTIWGSVGLMWMDSSLMSYRLVPGFQEPQGSPMRWIDRHPGTWVPHMAAAFNGGFRMGDGVGGYFYNGTTVSTLRPGLASLVVTKAGQLKILVWGRDIRSTTNIMAIRQNLPPLVWKGKAMTKATDNEATWGEADHGRWNVIRSAAGMLADGSIVYVYGFNVNPATMAKALVTVHARTGIMLDMNQSWPMGFYYDRPVGGNAPVGHRVFPQVYREPDSYYQQFTKDFIVALAP